jgi:hypothetical protein
MKIFRRLIAPLVLGLLFLTIGDQAQAQGDYCWCVRTDGTCENHRSNAAGDDIECGAAGATGCTAYCNDRTSDGAAWRAAHCDTTFINRSTSSTSEGGTLRCPPVSETPSEPAGDGGAPGGPSTEPIRLFNPLGSDITIAQFIGRGIRAVIGIVGALALLMFIYGGIVWMTAGGSQERITSAKNILKNSFIGLLLIFFSYTIISVFFSVLTG